MWSTPRIVFGVRLVVNRVQDTCGKKTPFEVDLEEAGPVGKVRPGVPCVFMPNVHYVRNGLGGVCAEDAGDRGIRGADRPGHSDTNGRPREAMEVTAMVKILRHPKGIGPIN